MVDGPSVEDAKARMDAKRQIEAAQRKARQGSIDDIAEAPNGNSLHKDPRDSLWAKIGYISEKWENDSYKAPLNYFSEVIKGIYDKVTYRPNKGEPKTA